MQGTKAVLITRILARFQLSRPCSTPLLVVAHTKIHAARMLNSIGRLCGPDLPSDSCVTAAQRSLCQQLRLQLVVGKSSQEAHAMLGDHCHLPAEMQRIAEARAQSAGPCLQAAFPSLKRFLEMAGHSWPLKFDCWNSCCDFYCQHSVTAGCCRGQL